MPSFVKVPRNESVLRQFGAYPIAMNIGHGATALQCSVRDNGLCRFEPATQSTLLTLVQIADGSPTEFFDIGAHVGMHSALIATVYPSDAVHVTSFEPTPRTAEVCRSIASANQLPIRIERCAVSVEDGTAELFISPWDTSNSLTAGFRPAQDVVSVPTVSLDSYCARRGIHPNVLKIDVETFESHVLLGGLKTFERSRPSIVCEVLPEAEPEATTPALTALGRIGYHMHRWMNEDGWQECSVQDVVDQIEHTGKDWLFTPEVIDDRFRDALAQWGAAVAECTANTTLSVGKDRATHAPPTYDAPVSTGNATLWERTSARLNRFSRARAS